MDYRQVQEEIDRLLTQDHSPNINWVETDSDEDELFEALNQSGPPTIKPPEPSDRTDKIVAWLTDPAVMLVDLTETLNQMLSVCRQTVYDGLVYELIPGEFHEKNLLELMIQWGFTECKEQVEIRNSIEPTPFSPGVIHDVERYFRICTTLFARNEKVTLETAHHFTNAIHHYKLQLQILADWIEARAIFQGKKTPDPNRPKKNQATEHDICQAIQMIVDSERAVTKKNLGDTIRLILKKTISNGRVQTAAHHFNRRKKNGPE